jgi:triosephosphate isomerase
MAKLIAANWKENPRTEKEALALFKEIARAKRGKGVTVALCAPYIYLEEMFRSYKKMGIRNGVALGVQDVFWEEQGAFTSEIGPGMIKSLGARYVIIGHSERRRYLKETDAMINKKIALAASDGLKIILCVGEPLAVREKGASAAKRYVEAQLVKGLKGIKIKSTDLFVAYEPIWAIGTGRSDSPADAREMAMFIKKFLKTGRKLKIKVLYGGSVNSKNAADYVQLKEIDGALVGGASLKAGEFKKIINL